MKTLLHAMFATLSFASLLIFFSSSVILQFWSGPEAIAQTRLFIFQGMTALIVMLVFTGLLGLSLSKGKLGAIVNMKKRRMFWILVISILFLLPAAYMLDLLANKNQFGVAYFVLQFIEYLFQLVTLCLMALNFRDGATLVTQALMASSHKNRLADEN